MADEEPVSLVVTVTPTLMAGTVVRWYWSESDAEQPGTEPVVSASRNGVQIGTFLHMVPASVLEKAQAVHQGLRDIRGFDVSHLATHRRRGLFGPLVPVPSPAG